MAGLRKAKKKRGDPNSPNKVLVIFLILFAILSIGLGGWTYSVFSQQADLEKKLADAKKALEPSQQKQEIYEFLALELLGPLGNDVELHKGELGETGVAAWKVMRDEFYPKDPAAPNRFKDNKAYMKFKELIDRTRADLDVLRAKGYKADSYDVVVADLQDRLKAAEGRVQTVLDDKAALDRQFVDYRAQNETKWLDMKKAITDGNAISLAAAREKSAAHLREIEKVQELQAMIRDIEVKSGAVLERKDAEIKVLQIELERAKDQTPMPVQVAVEKEKGLRTPHALMLDISRGRPLWDNPVGKITRVDVQNYEVYINVGSEQGVKPETTFNIFGPGRYANKPGGKLKGCIEVIRVIDAKASLARITCLYDSTGHEIPINDPTTSRVRRETENPLKEGDLIFNMVFGLHVALAGNINWDSNTLSDDPAQQMSKLQSMMRILKQQGVIVDAYLDLTEGRMIGEIKPHTKLLITGSLLRNPDNMNEHATKVNEAIIAARNHAIESGMFQISADNLQFVTGYRRPRSASDFSASGFRPSLISTPGF